MPRATAQYRGRFAPSPTGPLHLGSLITAVASYLDARHHHGKWLVRMEDLDPPRELPGAATSILHSLQQHGLFWDEAVLYQSTRAAAYADARARLQQSTQLFACTCARAQLDARGNCRSDCRNRTATGAGAAAIRMPIAADCSIRFTDQIQGRQAIMLGHNTTDFVVRRKDGLDAYQLAVVVDDAMQGITHVLRGSDLLDCTARQILLQQRLNYCHPLYGHVPVITNAQRQKFSKQNHAPALQDDHACSNIRQTLQFLQQAQPPATLTQVNDLLRYASEHWVLQQVPAHLAIAASTLNPGR